MTTPASSLAQTMAALHQDLSKLASKVDEAIDAPDAPFNSFDDAFRAHCALEDRVLGPAYASLDEGLAARIAAADATLNKGLAAAKSSLSDKASFPAAWRAFAQALRKHMDEEVRDFLPRLDASPNAAALLDSLQKQAPAAKASSSAAAHHEAPAPRIPGAAI